MSEQPLRFTSDRRAGRGDSTGSDGGRASASRPSSSASSPKVEAELAAIFGEDELLRRPPDPFEEKILTGRNSFDDLRDQLAQDDESAEPVKRPRERGVDRDSAGPAGSSEPTIVSGGRSERG
ncbi:MAG: hypothetical protein LBV00_01620, partial [Propionibacteriaceae bacterium]|nr:hypothetical protein [Propionibacteriaceae bacterium]